MLYQLPTGKTIEIPFTLFESMTDEDLEYMIAFGHGEEINNPFHNSALYDAPDEDLELPDVLELPDIPPFELLSDPDFIQDDV